MKTNEIRGIYSAAILVFSIIFWSCSRSIDHESAIPQLMPPIAIWPANILPAAEGIRTSTVNIQSRIRGGETLNEERPTLNAEVTDDERMSKDDE